MQSLYRTLCAQFQYLESCNLSRDFAGVRGGVHKRTEIRHEHQSWSVTPWVTAVLLPTAARNCLGSHIGTQSLGNHHASIRLLIVFEDRQPCASYREAAAVDRMNEFCLLF